MKRIACLFLCLLMLLCIGCKKEEPEQTPQLNKGTFYTSDGTQYNTHVKIKLTSTDLTTAATTLTVEMQNDTDYVILLRSDPSEYPWEKMGKDGEWVQVPTISPRIDNRGGGWITLLPHSTYTSTNVFSKLEAGRYRLRVTVDITDEQSTPSPDNYIIQPPATRCIAELRFDIVPG